MQSSTDTVRRVPKFEGPNYNRRFVDRLVRRGKGRLHYTEYGSADQGRVDRAVHDGTPHSAAPRRHGRSRRARYPTHSQAAEHGGAARYLVVMGPSLTRSIKAGGFDVERWQADAAAANAAGFDQ